MVLDPRVKFKLNQKSPYLVRQIPPKGIVKGDEFTKPINSDHLKEILPFEKREKEENKNKEIKVRWQKNLKRLVKQKLGHSRYPENPKRAGKQKLGKIKKKEDPAETYKGLVRQQLGKIK